MRRDMEDGMELQEIDRIRTDHDYIWARLPFLAPMAAKVARECRGGQDGCGELAALVAELRTLLLDHLEREERLLARLADEQDPARVSGALALLHDEHLAVGALLARIRDRLDVLGDRACATERALHGELALLDRHVVNQLAVEEQALRVAR